MSEAPTHTLSHNDLLLIEAPLIVRNVDKALEMLGGIETLSNQVSTKSPIELRLHSGPHARGAFAGVQQNPSMLLKVNKTTKAASIVGISSESYQFKGMADFQFVPTRRPVDVIFDVLRGEKPGTDEPLNIVPPYFSRITQPVNYRFRLGPIVVNRERPVIPIALKEMDAATPTQPPGGALEAAEQSPALLKRIQELFAERPIWVRSDLAEKLGAKDMLRIRALLAATSYTFTKGPFRTLYIRLGYDPRSDSAAAIYQVNQFHARVQPGEMHAISARAVPASIRTRKIVDEAHSKTVQFCDIEDPEIQELLRTLPRLETFSNTTGWFTDADYATLKSKTRHVVLGTSESEVKPPRRRRPATAKPRAISATVSNDTPTTSTGETAGDPVRSVPLELDLESSLLQLLPRDVDGFELLGEDSDDDDASGDEEDEEEGDDNGNGETHNTDDNMEM